MQKQHKLWVEREFNSDGEWSDHHCLCEWSCNKPLIIYFWDHQGIITGIIGLPLFWLSNNSNWCLQVAVFWEGWWCRAGEGRCALLLKDKIPGALPKGTLIGLSITWYRMPQILILFYCLRPAGNIWDVGPPIVIWEGHTQKCLAMIFSYYLQKMNVGIL